MKEHSLSAADAPKQVGETRRRFLAKMGLGAAALALVASPLGVLGRRRSKQETALNQDFPSEDSIFRPASDPRLDPRRTSRL